MKKLIGLIAAVGILLSAPAHAQLGGIGTGYSTCQLTLPFDANGWTVYPTAGSGQLFGKVYYVSTTEGNNTNSGLSSVANFSGAGGVGPVRTIAQAITLIKADATAQGRNTLGIDSWMLLKKGDTFHDQAVAANFSGLSGGINCLHPFVLSSYDPTQPGVPDPYGNFSVASITCVSTTATVTTTASHGWTSGQAYALTLTKELPAGFNGDVAATITGAATFTYPVASCPAASDTTHGIVTLSRPIIEFLVSLQTCLFSDGGIGFDYLIESGIDCYNYQQDPNNASYDKTKYASVVSTSKSLDANIFRRMENVRSRFVLTLTTDYEPQAANKVGNILELRRNVDWYSSGSFISGVNHLTIYQPIKFYDNWNPNLAAGQNVTIATGTPGVITWVNNPVVSHATQCSLIKFTGSPLPTGLVAGTTYFVVGSSGDTFKVDTTCGGTGIALSGSPASVIAYWQGTNFPSYAAAYPQPLVNNHSFYLQNSATGLGTWDQNFSQGIIGFTSGPACQCGGTMYENVFFQNNIPIATGKSGELPSFNTFVTSYNGIFEISPQYNTPTFDTTSTAFQGIAVGGRYGTYAMNNNLIAYAKGGVAAVGLQPAGINNQPAVSPMSNNLICSIPTPFGQVQGAPYGLTILNAGSGYTVNTAKTGYQSVDQGGIPAIGGSGSNLGLAIGVDGTTGQVSADAFYSGSPAVTYAYNMNGKGYKVGNIVSASNTYLGNSGSLFSTRVATVDGNGGATSFDTLVPGSNYRSQTIANLSGGTGTAVQVLATVSAGGTIQAVQPYTGRGSTALDTFTVSGLGAGSGGSIRVDSIVSNAFSNNTWKTADCNNLSSATSSGTFGTPNSVAAPFVAGNPLYTNTPPTDPIGAYFQSLAYGYQATVPTILASLSSGFEQGFMDAAKNQQKSNWDTNLMPHALMAWARPQFGMTNPP